MKTYRHKARVGAVGWLAVAVLVAAGCSVANIGGIRPSADVTRQFENFEFNPNFRYWYLNQENNPYGVVGLERDYRLDDLRHWAQVDPDSPAFRKAVGLVQSFPVPNAHTSGFRLSDPQGQPIGVWYSSLSAGITVDSRTKIVSISTAEPWLFDERQ